MGHVNHFGYILEIHVGIAAHKCDFFDARQIDPRELRLQVFPAHIVRLIFTVGV